mmetsp:Transcript_29643/g.43759  ORF Transcript_29643/g.43759 Transcript_29643/m.43759 type:complete len:509 (+) Transcript_29643:168-1694(+)
MVDLVEEDKNDEEKTHSSFLTNIVDNREDHRERNMTSEDDYEGNNTAEEESDLSLSFSFPLFDDDNGHDTNTIDDFCPPGWTRQMVEHEEENETDLIRPGEEEYGEDSLIDFEKLRTLYVLDEDAFLTEKDNNNESIGRNNLIFMDDVESESRLETGPFFADNKSYERSEHIKKIAITEGGDSGRGDCQEKYQQQKQFEEIDGNYLTTKKTSSARHNDARSGADAVFLQSRKLVGKKPHSSNKNTFSHLISSDPERRRTIQQKKYRRQRQLRRNWQKQQKEKSSSLVVLPLDIMKKIMTSEEKTKEGISCTKEEEQEEERHSHEASMKKRHEEVEKEQQRSSKEEESENDNSLQQLDASLSKSSLTPVSNLATITKIVADPQSSHTLSPSHYSPSPHHHAIPSAKEMEMTTTITATTPDTIKKKMQQKNKTNETKVRVYITTNKRVQYKGLLSKNGMMPSQETGSPIVYNEQNRKDKIQYQKSRNKNGIVRGDSGGIPLWLHPIGALE